MNIEKLTIKLNRKIQITLILLSIISITLFSYAEARFPFPQAVDFSHMIKPSHVSQSNMNSDCQKAYDAWLNDWVTDKGCFSGTKRVHVGNDTGGFLTAYDTVSEGIAWGMIILVFMENSQNKTKKYFDEINSYRKKYLDQFGMMHWRIDKEGNVIGKGGATEADENMAMALLLAHYQWGSTEKNNYFEEAKTLIQGIMDCEIEHPGNVVKPGDTWGGSAVCNPCYFSPAYYEIWSKLTREKGWEKVKSRSYEILNIFYEEKQQPLFPDWCQADGSKAGNLDYYYGYNACQIPLKIGMDYCWSGEPETNKAYEILDRIAYWFKEKTAGEAKNLVDGYEIDGSRKGQWNNACFVGPIGVASQCSINHQEWCNALYDVLRSYPDSCEKCYYCNTLRLVSMLLMSGNMPNFIQQKKAPKQEK